MKISSIYQLRVSLRQTFLLCESLSTTMTSAFVSLRRAQWHDGPTQREMPRETARSSGARQRLCRLYCTGTWPYQHYMSVNDKTCVIYLVELCHYIIANVSVNVYTQGNVTQRIASARPSPEAGTSVVVTRSAAFHFLNPDSFCFSVDWTGDISVTHTLTFD